MLGRRESRAGRELADRHRRQREVGELGAHPFEPQPPDRALARFTLVARLEFKVALRLYHEVTIAAPGQQRFEYVHCHPATGMLKGASAIAT